MHIIIAALLFLTATACQSGAPSAGPSSGSKAASAPTGTAENRDGEAEKSAQPAEIVGTLVLTSSETKEALKALRRVRATLPDDPFYKSGPKTFEGFDLNDIFGLMNGLAGVDVDAYSLRFVCEDGYQTTFPFSSVTGRGGVLAVSLVDNDVAVPFPVVPRGKSQNSAGPFYLVWDGAQYGARRPWPFQLVKIEIISNKALAARWEPPHGSRVDAGFQLFAKHCVACHSMNLKGGVMGPELNVPKNILTYRERSQLHAFIKAPQSFRSGSLMPPTHLDDKQLNDVLDYMDAMASRQVCRTQQSCEALMAERTSAP